LRWLSPDTASRYLRSLDSRCIHESISEASHPIVFGAGRTRLGNRPLRSQRQIVLRLRPVIFLTSRKGRIRSFRSGMFATSVTKFKRYEDR